MEYHPCTLLMFVRFVLLSGGINLTQLSTSAYSKRFGLAYIRNQAIYSD